jgi:TonB family protein
VRKILLATVLPVISLCLVAQNPDSGSKPSKEKGGVYRIGGGVSAPKVVFSPDPQCTDRARATKLRGTEELFMVVGPDGVARDVRVHKSLGSDIDKIAVDLLPTWRFEPAMKDGQPVAVALNVNIKFDCSQPGAASSSPHP